MQIDHHTTQEISIGLTTAEAKARLALQGANELPGSKVRSFPLIVRDVLSEPMFLLLLAACGIYLLLGELREAVALSASIVIVILITVLQERRTEHALARLKDMADPLALVMRDGVQVKIPSREVVVGDVLLVNEGDRVVADAVLISATALSADESMLTGESLPVDKMVGENNAEQSNQLYAGSLVVRGFATACVTATGPRSAIGKIGKSLSLLDPEVTPLFREVRRVVRWLAIAGLLLCTAIAVFYSLSRFDWLGGVLAGITLAMSVLPEEFPVVLTVFLAMGAWRLSRQSVLTRRMPAVEIIGAATILAVDKTGTLTENRMQVVVIDSLHTRCDLRRDHYQLSEADRHVLAVALAASERNVFDPMEHAIRESAVLHATEQTQHLASMELVHEYDLTQDLLAVTHVWQQKNTAAYSVCVKGAPEAVFNLCQLDAAQRKAFHQQVERYGAQGLRVLAIAEGEYLGQTFPASPHEFKLKFLGFVCLADPLRQQVPENLLECNQAGIRVVMMTGDHVGTALAIAEQAGIEVSAGALTGAQLATLSSQELIARTRSVNVYARMAPKQKLLLVQAFKSNGEIIVMTGDGVNDAPALKAAHVGVAMGGRGTEVARQAASLVLMKDDFAALVDAVRSGRRIYENIRHATSFIISVHIPIAGMGLFSAVLGWPLVLYPLHVMFLEFVIDPACSLVFEADAGSKQLMKQPPRLANASIFSRKNISNSLMRGALMLVLNIVVYAISVALFEEKQARALAFITLVLSSVLLIFLSRGDEVDHRSDNASSTFTVNMIHWWIAAVSAISLAVVLYVPVVAELFSLRAPPIKALSLVVLSSLALTWLSRKWRIFSN